MPSTDACLSRTNVTIVVASIVSLLVLSSFWLNIAHKAQVGGSGNITIQPSPGQIYECEDPYRRPGYLHIDAKDYKKTQWIPYTNAFLDAEIPSYAEYPPPNTDVFFNDTGVELAFLEAQSNPKQWMRKATAEAQRRRTAVAKRDDDKEPPKAEDFVGMKTEGGLGWLWGRRILLLGDSVDRFMMQFFCEEFGPGHGVREPAPHTTATCAVPALNLTLTHWHFPGSWTYRPEYWWMKDMKEIAHEERWDALWAPTIESVRGPNGRPDLLLWQSGLWDQRAMWEAQEAHSTAEDPKAPEVQQEIRERQLRWQEIRFVAARMKKLVHRLNDEFGRDVPAMFRAITVHRDSNATDANIYELDRISRAIGEQAGHETFEWGRLVTAFSMLYMDKTHTAKGPASWLWGNMVLEYVARSAGAGQGGEAVSPYFDGWEACHVYLNHWGGR